ncbi:hypothetical protein PilKf_02555 [Pillotina sp. SPG140]|jgi:hypothetical protein
MKNVYLAACALLLCVTGINAQNAQTIVDASRNRIKADTVSSRSRMVRTAKNGTTAEPMIVDQYSKDGPKGSRTVVVFQQPRAVAGTRFLTMESGNTSDQWIFLPSLGKVRRIAGSEGSSSFMGTDMSYDDVASSSRAGDADNHRLLREETLQNKDCYVIESIPKDSGYTYSKMIQWIGKADSITYKIELYDRRGALTKLLEILETKQFQGRLTPTVTKMSTTTAGTSTTIYIDVLKYDDPIPEAVFTTNYLETGKVR